MRRRRDFKLESTGIRPGGRAICQRSYPVGRKNFFRLTKDQLINLTVRFDAEQVSPDKVFIHVENLAHNKSRRYVIKLRGKGHLFQITTPFKNHGVSRFKVCYRQKRKWHWDVRPFSYVVVDPEGVRDLRIYTLIPNVSGHIGNWKADLGRIKALGFNMIHLLPITRMGRSESPYAAYDLFDLDPAFVNPADTRDAQAQIQDFVKAARDLGLRLCFDLVFNNVGVDSCMCQHRPEWLTEDPEEDDGIKRGGWSDGTRWHKWQDLAFINYQIPCSQTRQDLWSYMRQYALVWAGFAAQTNGMIRLDNLHSGDPLFMRWVLGEIRQVYPGLIVFGELFETEQKTLDLVLDYGLNFLLATSWEHRFVPELRGYIAYLHKMGEQLRYLFPVSSHDSGSPAQEFGHPNATIPRHVVSALLGPGPSGMVMGVEVGVAKKIDFIGRKGLVRFAGDSDFSGLITQLNDIVAQHDVFQVAGNVVFVDNNYHAVIGACRVDRKTKAPRFFVFANFDINGSQVLRGNLQSHQLSVEGCSFRTRLATGQFEINGNDFEVQLPPSGICVVEVIGAIQE